MSCARPEGSPSLAQIVQTHNVACGICVMKRENNYRWDERFVWQGDADLIYHAEANGLKMGYCCNARVDHLMGSIKSNINQSEAIEYHTDENPLLRAKWGDRYLIK